MGFERRGECRRCGRCCDPRCPHLKFVALRNIRRGEVLNPTEHFGKDRGAVYAVCDIFDTDITWRHCTPEMRKGFPDHPKLRYPECGYHFVDKETGEVIMSDCFSETPLGDATRLRK